MTDYESRFPDIEQRREAERLYDAWHKAYNEWRDADNSLAVEHPSVEQKLREASEQREAAIEALEAEYQLVIRAIVAEFPEGAAVQALEAASDAACAAYENFGMALVDAEDDRALHCAVSGIPITEDDETMEFGELTILARAVLDDETLDGLRDPDEEIEEAA